MKLLLDTQLLLWAAASDLVSTGSISPEAAALIDDPTNEPMFSVASIWDVMIKNGLARADFRVDPHVLRRGLPDNGYIQLPISSDHALAVAALPTHHRDPFDRILIARATVEGIILLTAVPIIATYPGPIRRL